MTEATHDYTKRCWGHDYTVLSVKDGGQTISISGWGSDINVGDFIVMVGNAAGETTRYQFTEIEYQADPADMWFGKAKFAPRPKDPTPPVCAHTSACDRHPTRNAPDASARGFRRATMPTVPDFSWLPTTRARYDQMLGAVPPALHLTRGFLVGEAQHHDDAGVPYFTAFRYLMGGEYETGSRPLSVAEFRVAVVA